MPLTPLDIESRRFSRRLYGYDRSEVDAFLRACADSLSQIALEREQLVRAGQSLRAEIDAFRKRENTLVEALAAAERLGQERKQQAQHEAQRIISEARRQAEQMIERTRMEMARIEQQIIRLKIERETFENRLNSLIDEHRRLLEIRRQEVGVAEKLQARTTRPPRGAEGD
ncbi:MAG: DivIVA domain-containing protein [Acidobacteriota bacterium]|nr:MAG: DivIVA domain-containing protein [Acidobacteriota bacterium]